MENQPAGRAARAARSLILWAVAAALAVAMTWPLAGGLDHLGRTQNSGDARFSVWNVAWVAHALTTAPPAVFDANIFHPHPRSLAFSEANLVAGLLAVPVWLITRNPFTSHNVVVLFAFASAFVVTWYLVRRLTGDSWAAATAAVLYAFCPYLFSHTSHIQLLMSPGIPLSMLAFHHLVDRPSATRGLALGLALAVTALSCAYYGIYAGLMVGCGTLFYAWSRGLGRSRQYWLAIGAGAALSIGLVLPFFLPYLDIQEGTGFARTLEEADDYAATWKSYLASAAILHRWMLPFLQEWGGEVLFPGFTALIFGAIGAAAVWRARADRTEAAARDRETVLFYGFVGLLTFWATLGPRAGLYAVLYEIIPVFSLLRAPGRMGLGVVLCLAVLAAFGVRALRRSVPARRSTAVGLLAAAAATIDLAQVPFPWRSADPLPRSYRVLASLDGGPVAEFPFYHRPIEFHLHTSYMLHSTRHWQPLVNGYSDYIPGEFRTLAVRLASFPSRDALDALRAYRVRYVTVNRRLYGGAAMSAIDARLAELAPYLKLLVDDGVVRLYEVIGYP